MHAPLPLLPRPEARLHERPDSDLVPLQYPGLPQRPRVALQTDGSSCPLVSPPRELLHMGRAPRPRPAAPRSAATDFMADDACSDCTGTESGSWRDLP